MWESLCWCIQAKICGTRKERKKAMPQPTFSQVREEYRRRGLARVRERDKALGFILGMVSFCILLFNFFEDPGFYPTHKFLTEVQIYIQVIPMGVLLYIALSISCRWTVYQIFVHVFKNVPAFIYVEIAILINPIQIGTIALQYATSTVGSFSLFVNLGLNLKTNCDFTLTNAE